MLCGFFVGFLECWQVYNEYKRFSKLFFIYVQIFRTLGSPLWQRACHFVWIITNVFGHAHSEN